MSDWKRDVVRYGSVSARTIGQMGSDVIPAKPSSIDPHLTKEQADICLNCPKDAGKCKGTDKCFEAMKRKSERQR